MINFPITKEWLLAGKAIFTIFWESNGVEHHYTYKINKKEKSAQFDETYFVNLLTGPDNTNDYTYMGLLSGLPPQVILTRKSKYDKTSLPVRALNRALIRVWSGEPWPENTGIKGEGRCGVCGRPLTHPDGIADEGYRLGFGPICWEKMNGG